jgi:arabinogalactan endo-1,4-beta-galactosidase
MTICERVNERNEVMGIEYWNDGKVRVVQSHGFSTYYLLKYQDIQKQYKSETCSQTTQRVLNFFKAYEGMK